MSVIINNLDITNNGSQLSISLEVTPGYNITSVLIWGMNDFKDYSLAKDLSYKLQQINNKEIFIVSASELNISKFEDIYFIEVDSNEEDSNGCSTCLDPTLGITYNLSTYYRCLLNYFFESNDLNENCKNCESLINKPEIITISLMLDTIKISIEAGFYKQAISLIKKIKKICGLKKCNNCPPINCESCNGFKII